MKDKIILALSLTSFLIASSIPAKAQWDLGNTSATDYKNSGGSGSVVGNVQPNGTNINGSPGQPYLNEANSGQAIMRNEVQSQNNQYGQQNNIWGQNQNLAAQSVGQQLPVTYTPRLSNMQNLALPAGLKNQYNGLPPTSLDSFVKNAGGHAEAIYGDEGTTSWPPISGLGKGNTINAGISGQRKKTLTTGHADTQLPSALLDYGGNNRGKY